MLPPGLHERFVALRRRPKTRAALSAEREAAVERLAFATEKAYWVPRVPLHPEPNEAPPEPVGTPGERDALAGLDASGRPVLVRSVFSFDGEGPEAVLAHASERADSDAGEVVIHVRLLTWTASRVEIVGFLTHRAVSHVTWVDLDDAGRPVTFATAGVSYNDFGKGAELATCDWEGDRCIRVRTLRADERGRLSAEIRVADYDGDGLARIRAGLCFDADDMPAALEVLEPDTTRWERRFDAFEADPLPPDDALGAWIEAVATAAQRVLGAAELVDPVAIRIFPYFSPSGDRPFAVAVERRYLDAAAGRVEPKDAVDAKDEPRLSLLDAFDEAGARAWRSLQRHGVWRDDVPELHERLQRRVSELSWPGGAVPLVDGLDSWTVAERVLGRDRIRTLLAGMPAPAPMPEVHAPPASVAELEDLLQRFGLPAGLAEQARWGLALARRGRGRSRLGGLPELPPGIAWPTSEGRALTHAASIDFAEVPDVPGRDVLPADGTLVVFADLTEEGSLWEPVVVGDDDRVRLIHVPAGEPARPLEPPPHDASLYELPLVWQRRKIRYVPVLTMPEEPEGLSDAERLGYGPFYEAVSNVTPGLGDPPHLLLGHPGVAQEDPRGPGDVSLLHLGPDHALGFDFLDGGDLTFYGSADDVRGQRWNRLTLDVQSH